MLHSDGRLIHPVRLTIFFSPYLATQPPWHRISSNKPHNLTTCTTLSFTNLTTPCHTFSFTYLTNPFLPFL